MTYPQVRFLVGIGLAALAVLVYGQDPKPKYRTSPVGYSDTPILPGQKWRVHDIDRPRPRVVTPGATPGSPPSDAIVLFDGKDLSKWTGQSKARDGAKPVATGWKVQNGYVEIVGGSGDLVS